MARLLALGLCAAGALAGKGKKYEDHTMDALAWLKENKLDRDREQRQ